MAYKMVQMPEEVAQKLHLVDDIVEKYKQVPGSLIPMLQEVQELLGYLPQEALRKISRGLEIPLSKVFGVVTFYTQFHTEPRGRNIIRVCLGTACHVRGGQNIMAKITEFLGVEPGGTTPDLRFTLERVACLGACGLAPVMMVNDQTHGRLTPDQVKEVLSRYQ